MTATPSIYWTTLTIDCPDAEVLGAFYSQLLGWEVTARDGAGWLQLRNPQGGISLNIQAEDAYEPPVWPEQPGRQAKMMHFEVLVNDLDAAVRLVLECGGPKRCISQRTVTASVFASCSIQQATPSACLFTASSGVDLKARRIVDAALTAGFKTVITECSAWAAMQRWLTTLDRITERPICVTRPRASCRIPDGSEAVAGPRISRAAPGPRSGPPGLVWASQ